MSDRKRAPLFAHLLAAASGMGFDPELAKDYWLGREEPWNSDSAVRGRLLKLIYLYVASAVIQMGVPAVLLVSILGYLGFRAAKMLYLFGVLLRASCYLESPWGGDCFFCLAKNQQATSPH